MHHRPRVTNLQRVAAENHQSRRCPLCGELHNTSPVKPNAAQRPAIRTVAVGILFQDAARLHQQGRPYEAQALCEQILQAQARHAGAWHLRGLLAIEAGHVDQGIEWIEKSLQSQPDQPAAHSNIGNALLTLDRIAPALERFEQALRLRPCYVPALYNRANALLRLRRLAEALQGYEHVLRQQPAHVNALNNQGLVLLELDRPSDALQAFERAIALDPRFVAPGVNRAMTLVRLGRTAEACRAAEQAVQLAPSDGRAWYVRATALRAVGQPDEALSCYTQALRLQPANAELWSERGALLQTLERHAEALSDYDQALLLKSVSSDVLYNRAVALRSLHRHDEAIRTYEQLLQLQPGHTYAVGNLLQLRLERCDWAAYGESQLAVRAVLERSGSVANPLLLLLQEDPDLQLKGARAYVEQLMSVQQLTPVGQAEGAMVVSGTAGGCASVADRRIRVAYLSADFGDHPVGHSILGVLQHHDRERVESIGVSFRPDDGGPVGRAIRSAFDRFFDVQEATDREVALMLQQRGCDIAVDLMGLTFGHRLGIFARRAAPLQVGFLGYAGTSGAPWLDYLIADEVVIPSGQEPSYSERIIRLPGCYLPFGIGSDLEAARTSRERLGLPADALVLCGFATAHKLNPPLCDVWMSLLRDIPSALLWLRLDEPVARDNLVLHARRHGVDPQRLYFAPRSSGRAEHLARLPLADLFLDTAPYNAHSTACDALWSGLPLITCAGRTFASRVAASVLYNAGLPELVAPDLAAYAQLARQLCRDPTQLALVRERLREARDQGRLFDPRAYTRALERAYRQMLTRHPRA